MLSIIQRGPARRNAVFPYIFGALALLQAAAGVSAEREVLFHTSFEDSEVASVSIEGPQTVVRGTSVQMRALARLRIGAVVNITRRVLWSSSNINAGLINPDGLVRSGNLGTTLISADARVLGDPSFVATRELTSRAPGMVRQWTFNEETGANSALADRIGPEPALLVNRGGNDAVASGGMVTMAGGAQDFSDYVSLPSDLVDGLEDMTIEIWARNNAVGNWTRVFDFGRSTSNYLFMSWSRFANPNETRIEWVKDGAVMFTADNEIGPFTLGLEHQIVVTINRSPLVSTSEVCWYQNGALRGCRANLPATLADLRPSNNNFGFNTLGRSKFAGDDTAGASYNEARIYDGALNASEAMASFVAGPVGGGVDITLGVVASDPPQVGRSIQMRAFVTSTGGPIAQDVVWSVSPPERATIDQGGLLYSLQTGAVTVTASLALRPSSQGSKALTILPAPNPTPGWRVTAANLIGNINALSRFYSVQSWDGMDWPANFQARGFGGHLQGVAQVGSTWVLSHSRDDEKGVLVWGQDNAWRFDALISNLGQHPGGIQASADVVAVTYKTDPKGIKFFRFNGSNPAADFSELTHLRIAEASGEAMGLAWHPDHGRYYLLDARVADTGVADSRFCRTTKLGAALSDPANRWECNERGARNMLVSSSGTQLMFDETERELFVVALYRPGVDLLTDEGVIIDITDPRHYTSTHRMDITRINFGAYDPRTFADVTGVHRGSRQDFVPQRDLYIHQPTFRWASGVLLNPDGSIGVMAVERCTSFQSEFPGDVNHLPCELHQDLVDYFILR